LMIIYVISSPQHYQTRRNVKSTNFRILPFFNAVRI
jgi:hypothetical protein